MDTVSINKAIKQDYQNNEAFNMLRTNIKFCGSDVKVIGITSSIPGEGKSTTSLKLAASLAETGHKVLFIDGDLRKSVMIGRYKVNKAIKGLTHYLSGLNTDEEILYQTNTENLFMIFSGPVPPNPSELLSNVKFTELIKKCKEKYDYIIIDTPPLGSVIDAAVISQTCDGMIIVVQAKGVSYKMVQRVKEQLNKANANILGVVLNKVNLNSSSYYGKYYGKYYGNYGAKKVKAWIVNPF